MSQTGSLSLSVRQSQVQGLVNIEETVRFWEERHSEFGDCMGAPGKLIQRLLRESGNQWPIVQREILRQEKLLLNEVVRVIRLLSGEYFASSNPFALKDNLDPINVLEIGCGTGNLTLELAKLETKENLLSLTSGDIADFSVNRTIQKLNSHGHRPIAKRVCKLVATSLTKKVKHPLLTDQSVFDKDSNPFDLMIKGRIGHRLLGRAWEKSYFEVCSMLSKKGAILFYEPLLDINNGKLYAGENSEPKTTEAYKKLMKKLKMREYLWNLFEVFDQIYVIGVFVKN